jgi:chemotaxis protein MotB
MMFRRRRTADKENLDRWLLTYADLITLLLAFFIVMYSISRVDAQKFRQVSKALSGALKGGDNLVVKNEDEITLPGNGVFKIGHLNHIGQLIENKFLKVLEETGQEAKVSTEITERGLVIHIMESALFRMGSAQLEGQARATLDLIAEEIINIPNHIRIEGHTDDIPIKTDKYPSNWELSSARATEVVRYMIETYHLAPDRLSALGYGEFRPLRPNNSFENRAQNRRVDIVVLTMEMTQAEPTSQFYTP